MFGRLEGEEFGFRGGGGGGFIMLSGGVVRWEDCVGGGVYYVFS